ncbi:MAG TPA: PPOX class F420-dependent oxidoreductase [Gaiellales bacterium]|jgi:PPOX class probable F420-dependent enzyme|nr:PPOX class F420-dependent oxidoreductase [Gaiellales bacterium]
MDEGEIRAFLSYGTRTGKLGVTRLDGSPMVVPIWFVLDDDDTLLFTTWGETIKAKSLRRDGRVSLCVDEERPPYSHVRVDGTTTLLDDPELLRTWATRIAARYMGAEAAQQFGDRNAVPGELLVRITPTRIVAEADIAA